jgi:hypothetical protein
MLRDLMQKTSASSIVGIPAFVKQVNDALAEVEACVPNLKKTRFARYAELLEEVARLSFPCEFPWKGDDAKQRKFFEAASQFQQLMEGLEVLRHAEEDTRTELLQRVTKGLDLPPADPEVSDDARNTLFELATAAALRRAGFEVRVPRPGAEDVRAVYPDLLPFLVECKRPTHDGALAKNIKKARHQLKGRRIPDQHYGLAVFGMDRSLGLAGEAAVVPSERLLLAAVDRSLLRQKKRVDEIQAASGDSLYPHASIGGLLLVGAVFPADRGGIYTVSFLRLFCTGPETNRTSRRIMGALKATVPFGP